ncbi:hypothetical protein EVAR_51810_1 [Eumeta japonica]|uniref:Uncharacterized protein n=1 Tax=Eumeta variegata TaxID=151549 RepID=A0A4C1XXB8_EUMVA|nr:hypothetical protein EVAR_51810_1 [Eumeta japonica]
MRIQYHNVSHDDRSTLYLYLRFPRDTSAATRRRRENGERHATFIVHRFHGTRNLHYKIFIKHLHGKVELNSQVTNDVLHSRNRANSLSKIMPDPCPTRTRARSQTNTIFRTRRARTEPRNKSDARRPTRMLISINIMDHSGYVGMGERARRPQSRGARNSTWSTFCNYAGVLSSDVPSTGIIKKKKTSSVRFRTV